MAPLPAWPVKVACESVVNETSTDDTSEFD
jgi:hypothetical protein